MQWIQARRELRKFARPKSVPLLQSFFKTGKGQYGEGDRFLGLTVPDTRLVAKRLAPELSLLELKKAMASPFNEERFFALMVLEIQFNKAQTPAAKHKIAQFFWQQKARINNWNLVDLSAYKIWGQHLIDNPKLRSSLYKLQKSQSLWDRRIAVVSTYAFIRQQDFKDILRLAKLTLQDKEDLMHKAVGWMLREVGKRNQATLTRFLNQNKEQMPRTMLRYAIERYPQNERKKFLARAKATR